MLYIGKDGNMNIHETFVKYLRFLQLKNACNLVLHPSCTNLALENQNDPRMQGSMNPSAKIGSIFSIFVWSVSGLQLARSVLVRGSPLEWLKRFLWFSCTFWYQYLSFLIRAYPLVENKFSLIKLCLASDFGEIFALYCSIKIQQIILVFKGC